MPIDAPLSQAQVFAETAAGVAAGLLTARPHLAGGQAVPVRYAEPAERPLGLLGAYDHTQATAYAWPSRPAGGVVDLPSVRLWIQDAVLRYLPASGGEPAVAVVSGYRNRVRLSSGDGLVENGVSYPRRSDLGDRDARVGDWVRVSGGATELLTTIQAVVPDVVAAASPSAAAAGSNAAAQPRSQLATAPTVSPTGGGASGGSLAAGTYHIQYTFVGPFGETWGSASHAGATPVSFTIASTNIPRVTLPALPAGATSIRVYLTLAGGAAGTEVLYASGVVATTYDMATANPGTGAPVPASAPQTAGTVNTVTAAATGTAYRAEDEGDLYEQYTVAVTTGSTGGDATTARLSVRSASGRDDAANVTPAAFAAPTAVGDRGLTVTWANGGGDFVAGQTWTVAVRQAWAAPTATAGGTYSGADVGTSFTYAVVVTRGGRYADTDKPQVTATRTDGRGGGAPVTVTAAAADVTVGDGATVQFSANGAAPGLRYGDVYYVTVPTATYGAYRTVVTASDLPQAVIDAGTGTLALGIRKTVDVPAARASSPPLTNWTAAADTLTVASAVDAYDDTLTAGGAAVAAPVILGTAFAEYRAWVPAAAGRVSRYTPTAGATAAALKVEVAARLGTVDPINPLAYGVWKAAVNANGGAVLYTGIADPSDLTEWQENLDALEGQKDVGGLVPLSTDVAVTAAYATHVAARSADAVGGEWRTAWFSPPVVTEKAVVDATTASTGTVVLATLGDNPSVSGTQYTLFSVPAGNGKFLLNGVRAGDTVRYAYSQDAFGETTWTEYTVSQVVNEDSLVVAAGGGGAVVTAQRLEVWRALKRAEVATDWAAAVAVGTGRHRYVWPPTVEADGQSVSGVFLAAALAAYAAAVAPNQSLRNLEVTGFDGATLSTRTYSNAQLNVLAAAGAVVVTQAADGRLYAAFARTPDRSSTAAGEEVVARADDAVRYLMYARMAQYFGRANVTDSALAMIRGDLYSAISAAKTGVSVARLGPLVQDISLTSLTPHPTLPDRVVAVFQVARTYPANDATVTLVF